MKIVSLEITEFNHLYKSNFSEKQRKGQIQSVENRQKLNSNKNENRTAIKIYIFAFTVCASTMYTTHVFHL